MSFYNRTKIVDSTPTIGTVAYTSGDVVGGLITLNVANAAGGGILRHVMVLDDSDQKAAYTLNVYNSAPTSIDDADAFAPTHADNKKMVGVVNVGTADYTTVNSNARAFVKDADVLFETTTGNIYVYAAVTGTPTYTASALTFRFIFNYDG